MKSVRSWHDAIFPSPVWLIAALLSFTNIACALDDTAQVIDFEVQGPWAYRHQFDDTHRAEFLATTRAQDTDMFLLLGCSTARIILSFIYLDQFPYFLRERGHVTVQLDQSDPIMLPSVLIDQKHITTDPRATRDLVSVLMRSNRLSVSVTDTGGTRAHLRLFAETERSRVAALPLTWLITASGAPSILQGNRWSGRGAMVPEGALRPLGSLLEISATTQ
jgi:hypothetical protein